MSAEIVQIRDYQSKRAIERAHKELAQEAVKILVPFVETESFGGTHPLVPFGGEGIDGMDLGKEPA